MILAYLHYFAIKLLIILFTFLRYIQKNVF
jgi:hypothetical protein